VQWATLDKNTYSPTPRGARLRQQPYGVLPCVLEAEPPPADRRKTLCLATGPVLGSASQTCIVEYCIDLLIALTYIC
jgi:hypothetical protein